MSAGIDETWLIEHLGICSCIALIPMRGRYARPKAHCVVHKTLAERWDSIQTQEEFDAALAADYRPEWSENRRRMGQRDPWAAENKTE